MSRNPLVSESESSSACASPALQSSENLSAVSQMHVSSPRDIIGPNVEGELKSSGEQKTASTRTNEGSHSKVQIQSESEDEDEDEEEECDHYIRNEMLKSKITTAASIMIDRLPPVTKQLVDKITEPSSEKITVRCQPIGSTPSLTPNVFKISYHQPVATLHKFILKKLKKSLPKGTSLYIYVNNSFAPAPDEIVGCLFDHFASGEELVVSYCTVVAFG